MIESPVRRGHHRRGAAVLFATIAACSLAIRASAHDRPHTVAMPGPLIAADEIWLSTPQDRVRHRRDGNRTARPPVEVEPLPPCEVSIETRGDRRYIIANGVPNHATGSFPGRGNPHAIRARKHEFWIPTTPTIAERPTPVGMGMFGVAINGVFFEAGTAEWWRNDRRSGWRLEGIGPHGRTLGIDGSNGHVQPDGGYHYHAVPNGLLKAIIEDGTPESPILIGWAADGFPIYAPWGHVDAGDATSEIRILRPGWRLKAGERPSGPGGRHDGTYEEDFEFIEGHGDLDRHNGRFGVTPEFPQGTYHYVVTDAFPFIGRSWKGTPSPGMRKSREGGRGAGRERGARPQGTDRVPGGRPPAAPPRRAPDDFRRPPTAPPR